jgi:phage-related protein
MGDGAAVGILITSATTTWRSVIKDNFIQAGTITIDDNTDLFYIIGNDLISSAVGATVGTMANEMQCDINVFRASGNRLACSNVCGIVVPPVDSTT